MGSVEEAAAGGAVNGGDGEQRLEGDDKEFVESGGGVKD